MDALQGLQSKIRKIETDRSNAEINLKCLALETKDYKELLKQKHVLVENNGILKVSQSKELEVQLEHAQVRCSVLEKQLEGMRKVMKSDPKPKKTPPPVNHSMTERLKYDEIQKSLNETLTADTSAIEKLNDLEKEHERLTKTQCRTEDKICKLEEKIRVEENHRKLLQDKTKKLQHVFGTKKKIDCSGPIPSPQPVKKKKRRKPSSEAKIPLCQSSGKPQPNTNHSPSHYLVDFSNIPFVVGKSTGKSHSLGANIQSVLSIMKSHNMLCCDESPRSCASATSKSKTKQPHLWSSCKHLQDLLITLQDEFAQLGFEHGEIVSQLHSTLNTNNSSAIEKERAKIVERMESKEKQIEIIREHLHKVQLAEKDRKKGKSKKENRGTAKGGNVQTVTAAQRSPEAKQNPNLDMYKKVKKLQSTLRKDDLKWV